MVQGERAIQRSYRNRVLLRRQKNYVAVPARTRGRVVPEYLDSRLLRRLNECVDVRS